MIDNLANENKLIRLLKFLRFFLFPISIIYAIVILFKNFAYKFGCFKPYLIPKKAIVVGNLTMGGTGKSPMVSFLTENLKAEFKINILSRGYGRKTKGYFLLKESNNSENVGDEPLMYKKKYKNEIEVAVCESRTEGIKRLLKDQTQDLFILDDAFQHRKVKAGFSILLSDYSYPFYDDFILPVGNLREFKSATSRAKILVYTKCPPSLTQNEKKVMIKKSGMKSNFIYFSEIDYKNLIPFNKQNFQLKNTEENEIKNVLLVTGIANPKPLENYLALNYNVTVIKFSDHHNYNLNDIANIHKKFDIFAREKKAIITTEKDFVRISCPEFSDSISEYPWFYQEITIKIDREEEFLKQINNYVRTI